MAFGASARDETPRDPSASPGERLFVETGCGSCHTFTPAGTDGRAGTNLDDARLTTPAAAAVIRDGAAGMPGYADGLSEAEILQVAEFVTTR
jgi:mono/diheme cytochrome c family protein